MKKVIVTIKEDEIYNEYNGWLNDDDIVIYKRGKSWYMRDLISGFFIANRGFNTKKECVKYLEVNNINRQRINKLDVDIEKYIPISYRYDVKENKKESILPTMTKADFYAFYTLTPRLRKVNYKIKKSGYFLKDDKLYLEKKSEGWALTDAMSGTLVCYGKTKTSTYKEYLEKYKERLEELRKTNRYHNQIETFDNAQIGMEVSSAGKLVLRKTNNKVYHKKNKVLV